MSGTGAAAQQIDDATLMQRIAARDEAALRALYARHSGMVFAICLRILRDRSEAEQVLIDVFAEAWQHAARYDTTRGTPGGYLALLARSRAIDVARSRKRSSGTQTLRTDEAETGFTSASGRPSSVAQPIDATLSEERCAVVAEALNALGENQRTAVELAFYDGLSHSEIAVKLDRPIGTVKTQIRQGLIRMRDALREYWEGANEDRTKTTRGTA